MFGQSVTKREFFAAAYRKTFECLRRVVLYPGVASLGLYPVLYSIAEYKLTSWYFVVGSVWKPAFPLSWRVVFLSLFVVPALSSIQLLRLCRSVLTYHWRRKSSSRLGPSQLYMMLPQGEANIPEEGAFANTGDDEEYGSADVEGDTSPRIPSQRQTSPSALFLRFTFWLAILFSSLGLAVHHQPTGDLRYLPLIEYANAHPKREGYANGEKIFIAAMFSNNERVIPYWSDSLVKAIHYLGEDNVFVSIVESGSKDQSPAFLRRLDERLGAMHVLKRILTEDRAITKPDDMNGNNRIYFLSALRNRALEPLVERGGYDKVLFSNDVYIEPETIIELVKTAEGEYDMVCGMDFGPWGLYDLWVVRDKQGRLPSSIWPYFFDQEGYEAMQSESPVPVFTCWNGIVVFNADPVLPIHLRSNHTLSSDSLPFELPATHPAANDPLLRGPSPALTPPIGFRASAPGECFSSECFLLPYDFRRVFNLQRILVNQRVIVGYEWRFYVYFKWFMRHAVLRWWIEKMYDGAWMQKDVKVVGNAKLLSQWDGGDCHPWQS